MKRTERIRFRRKQALTNLLASLSSGTKTEKGTFHTQVSLTDKDRKRMSKEISTLEERIQRG